MKTTEYLEYCHTEIHINGSQPLPYQLSMIEFEDRANWLPLELPEDAFFELHTIGTDEHWTNDVNRKVFICPYHVVMLDETGEELQGNFRSEEEAVKFVTANNSNIPGNLTTLNEINDYCMNNELEILWYYYKTEISNVCPPITAKMINCLIEAINNP